MSSQIRDIFEDVKDYEELLEKAEKRMDGDWEKTFTEGMRERYGKYGKSMYLSEKQLEILEKIAGEKEDDRGKQTNPD